MAVAAHRKTCAKALGIIGQKTDGAQQFRYALIDRVMSFTQAKLADWLGNDVADPPARIEAGMRILRSSAPPSGGRLRTARTR
ncbi:hypothetical protein Rhsp01_43630 [Rhizobium sp. NBRC 114257]|uniref:Uncharacterized protein n=1 Tax=Rhizobium dioscoreae TaxID=2653122 RepID=A0ABQ0Z9B5_9HYPH|nr:hypothetical protein RsS93_47080 [Rhizobium dioscoreae]GLU83187.1 hypothetical protein Rhsp01_43630 [Rhizobium sp. NBRC 114257]